MNKFKFIIAVIPRHINIIPYSIKLNLIPRMICSVRSNSNHNNAGNIHIVAKVFESLSISLTVRIFLHKTTKSSFNIIPARFNIWAVFSNIIMNIDKLPEIVIFINFLKNIIFYLFKGFFLILKGIQIISVNYLSSTYFFSTVKITGKAEKFRFLFFDIEIDFFIFLPAYFRRQINIFKVLQNSVIKSSINSFFGFI